MLLTKFIKIKWNSNNKEWYLNKGYIFTKIKDHFEVKTKDLMNSSNVSVLVKCDDLNCGKEEYILWTTYKRNLRDDNKYYCKKCNSKMKSTSLEQWCIDNNRNDILDLWDYELNDTSPNLVLHSTSDKYYFKCPNGKQESECKSISKIIYRNQFSCNQCNSFAQYLIDTYGENALDLYWDWNKNNEIGINPWNISKCYTKKVWIICQEKYYHGSYDLLPDSFIGMNCRCPYCSNQRVHELDSLASLFPQVLEIWSDKNKNSPFEYSTNSGKKVWWKCLCGKHKDYFRKILDSNTCDFRCPSCQTRKGEFKIEQYLVNNKVDFVSQKRFKGLSGVGNKKLSYDFYIPRYNLLIEYQGEQHEKPIDFGGYGIEKAKENFKRQLEHDRRKIKYAKDNNIELLEVWYYDYDNIENILNKHFSEQYTKE